MNKGRTARRWFVRLVLAGLVVGVVPATAAEGSASAAPRSCGVTWGSLAKKSQTPLTPTTFRAVRAGHHPCYDRVVVDLSGSTTSYLVGYVPGLLYGSTRREVSVRGGAMLAIWVQGPQRTPAHPSELVDVRNLTTVRQVAWGGTDDGYTPVVVGTRARLPYRAFVITDGATSRLVVDIAHHW